MPIIYSPKHCGHATENLRIHGEVYPEVPARAEALLSAAQAAGLGPVRGPDDLGLEPILAVHAPDYVEFLRSIYAASQPYRAAGGPFLADTFPARGARRRSRHPWAQIGHYCYDIEAPFLEGTWPAVYASAQCALTAADLVRAGAGAAYALCRPPGHHALADQAGGFCYLNNAALAARRLQARDPGARAAILDIDYHHGNGTQEIFYRDPSVCYVSLHGHPDDDYPFYWGEAAEAGEGPGLGSTINLPLPKGTEDAGYLAALEAGLAAVRAFGPRYLVLSLGLDIAAGDPAALGGGFAVSVDGFRAIGERIRSLALPTVLVQEGGYRLDTLGQNAAAVLAAFAR